MTVHTMRQITALQRAHVRWQATQATRAIQTAQPCNVIPVTRTPTLIDRINHAVARAEQSRITWLILGASFVVGYVWIIAQVLTVYTGAAP